MIIDKLVNLHLYVDISERIKNALNYILETDFSDIEAGKYELNNSEMFVIVNEYTTKPNESDVLEAHKKYIDLQYVTKGSEIVHYEMLDNHVVTKQYDEGNDYLFYKSKEKNKLRLSEGMFAVFFPDDLHMPGIIDKNPENVKKIVVKIRIN